VKNLNSFFKVFYALPTGYIPLSHHLMVTRRILTYALFWRLFILV